MNIQLDSNELNDQKIEAIQSYKLTKGVTSDFIEYVKINPNAYIFTDLLNKFLNKWDIQDKEFELESIDFSVFADPDTDKIYPRADIYIRNKNSELIGKIIREFTERFEDYLMEISNEFEDYMKLKKIFRGFQIIFNWK